MSIWSLLNSHLKIRVINKKFIERRIGIQNKTLGTNIYIKIPKDWSVPIAWVPFLLLISICTIIHIDSLYLLLTQ